MKILAIQNGKAIVSGVEKPVPLKEIKGSVRVGALLDSNFNVIGNNVDENCLNGACEYQPPQGK